VRILAIDADPLARITLARGFEARGDRVLLAAAALEGVRLARAKRPRVVLLGEKLSDGNGLDVCRTLKGDPATQRIPIVLMMDHSDAIERAVARELGATDYLVKPFSLEELVARVDAAFAGRADEDGTAEAQRFGRLTLRSGRARTREAWVEGARVELTPIESALLLVLCEGGERVHARSELRARIWGEDGRDETRLVDQYVKRLRKKLGSAGLYIETVHGVGYRFAKARAEQDAPGQFERSERGGPGEGRDRDR
jgi:two-component system phosphate regulon response regulator PhoB